MPDREAIRDNARYLRNVRPVDPEEICEYVDGQPHPAVVRTVLREEAFDLSLLEREDGTFAPVSEDPAPRPRLPVEAFPERYARRLEDLLVERHGTDWHRGDSGDALRERIRDLKERYHRGWDVEYDDEAALGYACYHLADYYAAIQYVLAELAEVGLLDRRLRVLDVGAGTGGPALGLHDALPEDALVQYEAIEPGSGVDVLEAMLEETGKNFRTTIHRETAEAFDPVDAAGQCDDRDGSGSGDGGDEPRGYDLVVFANVLSELDDPEGTTARYLEAVADDGSMVLLSPADRHTTHTLRSVERALADGGGTATGLQSGGRATVFSPTVRLWPGRSPADEGWSFVVRPDLDVPAFQRRLDEPAGDEGEFVNVDVQYSYATLRQDGERRIEFTPDRGDWARLDETGDAVSERIDCVAIKLSGDLSGGGNPLFKVGDGSEQVDHFAVLTRETSLNVALWEAGYGDLLTFESVLALWNDDEASYNLVVDGESVVESVPAPVR